MNPRPAHLLRLLAATFFVLLSTLPGKPQTSPKAELRSSGGHDAQRSSSGEPYAATREVRAALTLQLAQADAARTGEVWLEFTANSTGRLPAEVLLRVPLSSTGDAYGESRSCNVAADGRRTLTFTAGLDERNFVAFRPAAEKKQVNLLLNKYLCRAMATAFDCNGQPVTLPAAWDGWRLAGMARLRLTSEAPATLETSPVVIAETDAPFTRAQCAVVAPSDGICCVAGHTTKWHCGGKPAGEGWQQVSGDCYHQTTSATCKD